MACYLVSRSPGETKLAVNVTAKRRVTAELAEERNLLVAALADVLFIPHASPGGKVERLFQHMHGLGKPVHTLDDDANDTLLKAGAIPLDVGQLIARLEQARKAPSARMDGLSRNNKDR